MNHKATDPGKGYRLLKAEEEVKKDDEFFDWLSDSWHKTVIPGELAGEEVSYRRKVEMTTCTKCESTIGPFVFGKCVRCIAYNEGYARGHEDGYRQALSYLVGGLCETQSK